MAKPFRLISRTVKDGKVQFNQVFYEQKANAQGKFLVAIDEDAGMHVWLRTHGELLPHATGGQEGYAKHLLPIDLDAPYLGPSVFVAAGTLPHAVWQDLLEANTRAKQQAVARVFGFI